MKKTILALWIGLCALAGHADTLARTNWFDSSGLMTASPGHLLMPLTNSAQYWTTYFAPTNSPILLSQPGNQIKVTWTFTATGVQSFSTVTPLAFGLINTPDASRLTSDGSPSIAAYAGFATFLGAFSGKFGNAYQVAGRTDPATASALFTESYPGYAGWSNRIFTYAAGLPDASGVPFTLTLTLIRNAANGLEVNSVLTGNSSIVNQGNYTDSAPNTFAFNTVSIFGDGNNSGTFNTTGFKVEFFPTSPPVVNLQPASRACFPGNAVSFVSSVSGTLPLSYQWTYNGTNILGQTNDSLTLSNVDFNQTGIYALQVTNNIGSTLSSNALLTVYLPPACVPPPAGLVSWWPADGNALDIVGGNNGILYNGVGYRNGQEGGQCFQIFGGNSAVEIGDATNLQLQDFTIETWIQRTSPYVAAPYGGPGMIFSYAGGGYGFGLNDNGTLYFGQIGVDGYSSTGSIGGDLGWHQVAVTKSGTNVFFYVDGNPDAMLVYTNQFEFSTSACIGSIGDHFGFPQHTFYGAIDELSIYNRALSAAEIQAIYQAGGGGKCQQAPSLSISRSAPNVVVTWPVWAAAFNLQTASGRLVSPGNWTNQPAVLQTNGLNLRAAFPMATNQQFFRLQYPMP